jgi:hypothetical protein
MPPIAVLSGPLDESPQVGEVTWDELAATLSRATFTDCNPCPGHDCPAKRGRAWLPVRYKAAPSRSDADVAAITFAVFDLDDPTPAQMGEMGAALEGLAYLCHQSHRGNGYRLVLPLLNEVPSDQWPDVWQAIVDRYKIPADPNCKNVGRIYFAPTRPAGAGFDVFTGQGSPLDWRRLDVNFPEGPASALEAFKAANDRDRAIRVDLSDARNYREGIVNLDELRRGVKSMRNAQSSAALDRILKGLPIAEPGKRDTEINRAMSVLATSSSDKPYPWDSVRDLVAPSIRAMDCEPEGFDHWLAQAQSKYKRALVRRLENDARADADRVAILGVLGMGPEAQAGDWRKELLYKTTPDGEPGGLQAVGANANSIFRNSDEWRDSFRFNEITKEIDVIRGPLLGVHKASLDVEAGNWLARSEYRLSLKTSTVGEQLLACARTQAYDPLRDELLALRWDQTERVGSFFEKYFGAHGNADHLKVVSRCFLISLVARGLDPGCEVHTVPILVGGQGVGKSRGLAALGGKFFSDTELTMGDKDSRLATSSKWLIELAELSSIRNARDIERIKGFVSQRYDDLRPPYGRVTERFLRRCVFVGTSNQSEILSDWTGERRWWPINVKAGDVEGIRRDREQLLAEAVYLYQHGVRWWLSADEAARAEEVAQDFKQVQSGMAEHILIWFSRKAPADRPKVMMTEDVVTRILGIMPERDTPALRMQIGNALRELGFVRSRKRMSGKPVWVYVTPNDLILAPQQKEPSLLSLVHDDPQRQSD